MARSKKGRSGVAGRTLSSGSRERAATLKTGGRFAKVPGGFGQFSGNVTNKWPGGPGGGAKGRIGRAVGFNKQPTQSGGGTELGAGQFRGKLPKPGVGTKRLAKSSAPARARGR